MGRRAPRERRTLFSKGLWPIGSTSWTGIWTRLLRFKKCTNKVTRSVGVMGPSKMPQRPCNGPERICTRSPNWKLCVGSPLVPLAPQAAPG